MTLGTVLDSIERYDSRLTIYASRQPNWSEDSEAVVALEPEDGSVPLEAAGLTSLLKIGLAQEVLAVWSSWRSGAIPTTSQRCEAVIHYATYDSYLPID